MRPHRLGFLRRQAGRRDHRLASRRGFDSSSGQSRLQFGIERGIADDHAPRLQGARLLDQRGFDFFGIAQKSRSA